MTDEKWVAKKLAAVYANFCSSECRIKALHVLFDQNERTALQDRVRVGWQQVDRERKRNKEDKLDRPVGLPALEAVPGKWIVEVFADKLGLSADEALREIGARLGWLNDYDVEQIDSTICNDVPSKQNRVSKPKLHSDGTLTYKGEVIAKFRSTKTKSRSIKALEMFQRRGWIFEVRNTVFKKKEVLPDIASRLRARTKNITFNASVVKNTLSLATLLNCNCCMRTAI